MTREHQFSSRLEFANLVASSGLLDRSWTAISGLYAAINSDVQPSSSLSLQKKVHHFSDLTLIALVTTPICTERHFQAAREEDLVSSTTLKSTYRFPVFDFLCTKKFPSISFNKTAISLFHSHFDQLCSLISQIDRSKPLIVTGHALGGSIASLFTLWLLDAINFGKRNSLCITFGSPPLADESLQGAISRSKVWNSCFLHVVSHQDAVLRSFNSHQNSTVAKRSVYEPFGTFLLCSDYGYTCSEYPSSIRELILAMDSIFNPNQVLQTVDYGNIVKNLDNKVICKDSVNVATDNPLRASVTIQLWELGFAQDEHQQQQTIDINALVTRMERVELRCILQRRKHFDPTKKLCDVKIQMANLEWYKKVCKTRGCGYYDAYKNEASAMELQVLRFVRILTFYWKDMVEEAEMMSQKERDDFLTHWIRPGTSYRRMVEPLEIAFYYKEEKNNYVTKGRSKHYVRLEEWQQQGNTPRGDLSSTGKDNPESILTLDSCFWAHVEEAILLCKLLRTEATSAGEKELAEEKLIELEEYVFGLIKNYAVSPDIFLKESSYMKWWGEYMAIRGTSYTSTLANFMRNPDNYKHYAEGALDFC